MADWEQLRELTHQVAPPDFEALARTARNRKRRARIAAGALAGLVVIGGGFGIAAIDDDSRIIEPAEDPSPSVPDGVQALPGPDAGTDFASLDAGRYRVPLSDTLAFDIDLPDGTSAHDDGLFLSTGPIVIKTEIASSQYGVPLEPCSDHSNDPVGPIVDDLVQAIDNLPIYQVTRPEPVELGGADGIYFEARIPRTYDASQCADDAVKLPGNPTTPIAGEPPYIGRWWILSVDGVTVVVQQNCWSCSTDQLDRDATRLQSINFTSTQ
jgi:hypothetical protein